MHNFLMDSLWTAKLPFSIHGLNAFPVIIPLGQPFVLGAYILKVCRVLLVNVAPICCIPARVFFVNQLLRYADGNPAIKHEILSWSPVYRIFEFLNPTDKVGSLLNWKFRSLVRHI